MINLTELRVFVAAADEGNFSRAAERLQLSQSAVSQNIQSIERAYGVELFVRRGRSVELSEAGQTILPVARELLNSSRLLEDTMLNVNSTVGGELLIGCSTSAGRYLMPSLLSIFLKQYPQINPRVRVMSRDHVTERLLNETIPLGLASQYFDHHELECIPMFDDKIILIVPADHPWAEYGRAMVSDLLDQKIIMREETSGTRLTLCEGLKGHGITQDMLSLVMELGSAEAIEMAVERGIGIAFVSEMVAARGLALGLVKQVEIDGLTLRRTVWMARRVGYPFTRAQTLFWQFAHNQREKLNNEIWKSLTTMPCA